MGTIGESIGRIARAEGEAFRLTWEYIGIGMALSALWFFISFLPTGFAAFLVIQLPSLLLMGVFALLFMSLGVPGTTAIFHLTAELGRHEEVKVRDFFRAFRIYFRRSFGAGFFALLIFVVLGADLLFASTNPSLLYRVVLIFFGYMTLFWGMMLGFVLPLLVHEDRGLFTVAKQAALLALDNVGVALVNLIVTGLAIVVSLLMPAALLLISVVFLGFSYNRALAAVLERYERVNSDNPDQE